MPERRKFWVARMGHHISVRQLRIVQHREAVKISFNFIGKVMKVCTLNLTCTDVGNLVAQHQYQF